MKWGPIVSILEEVKVVADAVAASDLYASLLIVLSPSIQLFLICSICDSGSSNFDLKFVHAISLLPALSVAYIVDVVSRVSWLVQ